LLLLVVAAAEVLMDVVLMPELVAVAALSLPLAMQ
jgi:hypothetical protein